MASDKERTAKLTAIKKAEYIRKLWPRLQRYAKGEIRSGLNRIEVPVHDKTGEIINWRSVTAPDELFAALLDRNIAHFAQAKNTPFVNGVFGTHLHPFEQNAFSESILDGTVDLTNFDINDAIRTCVAEMQYPPGEDGTSPISIGITADDFRQGFKALAEDLSLSPSGRHLGHYKAVLQDPDICQMYATMMSLPFEYGFSLHRWERVIQVMLEKTKNVPRIDKLRVIQLIEAEPQYVFAHLFWTSINPQSRRQRDHSIFPMGLASQQVLNGLHPSQTTLVRWPPNLQASGSSI